MSDLHAVRAAAFLHESSGAALRDAVIDARDAGATITDLARAAGVTRQTIYRWIAHGPGPVTMDTRRALSDALRLLGVLIDGAALATVTARVGSHDIGVLVRGVEIGIKSLAPSAELSDEQRSAIGLAGLVVAEAKSRHADSGHWPDVVTIRAE